MSRLKAANVKVIHKSATVAHALKAESIGVDLIEIAGFEASIAGYAEDDFVGTWVLLAKVCNKLKKTTPVVVSGSTCTGRQLAAALSMGACGVVMGTRFLATVECPIQPSIKAFLAKPETDEYSTTVVLRSVANGTRVLKNAVSAQILALEATKTADFNQFRVLAAGERTKKMWQASGDVQDAMWSVGQGVGLVESVLTVKVNAK
jgi:nitronate monooxygenase